jgi:two-component system NtrC family sensor kinase
MTQMPKRRSLRHRTSVLGLKLTACLMGALILVFAGFGSWVVRFHRRTLEDMVLASADRTSDIIKRSTRYSMMKNHRDEVYHIIRTIGAEPGMNKIRIFNEEGKISFSTDDREVNTLVDKRAEACYGCHGQEQPLERLTRPDRVRIYTEATGERILGLINPIENEPSCSAAACHAHPPEKQILGVLDVTMSLARVDEVIQDGQRRMVAGLLFALLVVSLVVSGFIWVMVHRPIEHLLTGIERVAAGDLSSKITLSRRDEMGMLAASFNEMTEKLNTAYEEITRWAHVLEDRVEEKTRQLQRAHEQMLQVERMASMGKLAAIVAHEINNPLAGILTSARLLLKQLDHETLPENVRRSLELIARESARCGELVKNLLQFARSTKVTFRPHRLNDLIEQSLQLVEHKIDLMGVTTRRDLDPSLGTIVCDAQQITQALVALLINSCEAMRPGEGLLEVVSRRVENPPGAEILIRDNGIGMDAETQRRIFEPFFTTKETGSLGLGLAVVLTIITHHGGQIAVESAPGQGTTFILRLPERPPHPTEADDDSSPRPFFSSTAEGHR